MKKFVIGSLVTAVLTVSSVTMVGGQEPAIAPPEKVNATPGMLTNMIDDINVPWEILEYVQMKYEGHAVTKAEKVKRNGHELYRLRVDRDSIPTDYESIALLFDMKWKLVGEEKYATSPAKPAPKVEDHQEITEAPGEGELTDENSPVQTEEKPPLVQDPAPTPDPEPAPGESTPTGTN